MKLHFASVPVVDSGPAEDDLNRFLASHKIAAVDRQLIVDGQRSAWAICVTCVEDSATTHAKQERVDYRKALSAADFAVYAKLREARKTIAERDGVPPYAIFTNDQLASMVTGKARTVSAIAKIDGVGPSREKHCTAMLEILAPNAEP